MIKENTSQYLSSTEKSEMFYLQLEDDLQFVKQVL